MKNQAEKLEELDVLTHTGINQEEQCGQRHNRQYDCDPHEQARTRPQHTGLRSAELPEMTNEI